MGKRNNKKDYLKIILRKKDGITSVISIILICTIFFSVTSGVLIFGPEMISESRQESHIQSDYNYYTKMYDGIKDLTKSGSGTIATGELVVEEGSVEIDSKGDKIALSYCYDHRYDFTSSDILYEDGSFTINMKNGQDLDKTLITWLDDTCFLAGTKVLLADNSYKNIEDIKTGDIVVSYNEETGKLSKSTVKLLMVHEPEEMQDFYLIINDELKVTPNHKFYSEGKWVFAGELSVGDNLFSSELKNYEIKSIKKIYNQEKSYDLDVEDIDNFYVKIKDKNILVHNSDIFLNQVRTHIWPVLLNSTVEFEAIVQAEPGSKVVLLVTDNLGDLLNCDYYNRENCIAVSNNHTITGDPESDENDYIYAYMTATEDLTWYATVFSEDGGQAVGEFFSLEFSSPGEHWDEACKIVMDSDDNFYVVGYGVDLVSSDSSYDWWIKKFDSNGVEDTTNWDLSFDGVNNQDKAYSVAIDSNHNVYVVGYGENLENSNSFEDWWIKKFDSNGNEDTSNWDKQFGSSGYDIAYDVAIDSYDNVWVVGHYDGDWLIKKYDSNGNELKSITKDGGGDEDVPYSIAIDSNDNVYVVGKKELAYPNGLYTQCWIKKFNNNGNEIYSGWNKDIGQSSSILWASDVTIDSNDNVYVSCRLWQGPGYDFFIKKYDASGSEDTTNWNKNVGGGGGYYIQARMETDSDDNLYVSINGNIKKFDSNGNEDIWAWNREDYVSSLCESDIAINSDDEIFFCGNNRDLVRPDSDMDWIIKSFQRPHIISGTYITVEDEPPVCNLIVDNINQLNVTFLISASDDVLLKNWTLDIDNDGIADYNYSNKSAPLGKDFENHITHTYPAIDNYTAVLRVWDINSKMGSDVEEIHLSGSELSCKITVDGEEEGWGRTNTPVWFNAVGRAYNGYKISKYAIYYGDGGHDLPLPFEPGELPESIDITTHNSYSLEGTYYVKLIVWDNSLPENSVEHIISVHIDDNYNSPPNPYSGNLGITDDGYYNDTTYDFTINTIDNQGDNIEYKIDWGDGVIEPWSELIGSGTDYTCSHNWSKAGVYEIRIKAKDQHGMEGFWSEPIPIKIKYKYIDSYDKKEASIKTPIQDTVIETKYKINLESDEKIENAVCIQLFSNNYPEGGTAEDLGNVAFGVIWIFDLGQLRHSLDSNSEDTVFEAGAIFEGSNLDGSMESLSSISEKTKSIILNLFLIRGENKVSGSGKGIYQINFENKGSYVRENINSEVYNIRFDMSGENRITWFNYLINKKGFQIVDDTLVYDAVNDAKNFQFSTTLLSTQIKDIK